MKLPSKNIFITSSICVIALGAVIAYTQKDLIFDKKNPTLEDLVAGSTPIALKSREFYEKNIPQDQDSTITENLSRDFFLNAVEMQNNGTWNPESQAELIDSLASEYVPKPVSAIKASNLAVFSDKDIQKIRDFGNKTAEAITRKNPNMEKSVFDILSEEISSSSGGSKTLHARLAPAVDGYMAVAIELQKIPAPATQAGRFADFINTYHTIARSTNDMSYHFEDPVRGFIGINNYQLEVVNLANLLKNLADYFESSGILFSNTEAGSVWSSLSS